MEDKQDLTILVVDDNPVSIKLLQTILRKEGYQVIAANDGPKAREIACELQPNLIVLDVMMPGEDGFQVITHLKTRPQTASIPVIFLTGRNELDAKLSGFDLGAVDYITKPFQAAEVLARVRLHLKLSLATNSLIANQASRLRQLEEAQTSMLTAPHELPKARFSVYYAALLEAGGDFYDVFQISDDLFGYFVADVAGHDIATSYITAAVKALLKQNCAPIYEPAESMRMINDVLVEILPDWTYLTASYVKLNRKAKRMSIVNAGHPPAVYIPKEGKARLIDIDGDIIGTFTHVYYGQHHIKVAEGDRFFLYSDGLIEKPARKKMWPECLRELLEACRYLEDIPIEDSALELTHRMISQTPEREDDIVILGVEV